jgi:hypothetical protein
MQHGKHSLGWALRGPARACQHLPAPARSPASACARPRPAAARQHGAPGVGRRPGRPGRLGRRGRGRLQRRRGRRRRRPVRRRVGPHRRLAGPLFERPFRQRGRRRGGGHRRGRGPGRRRAAAAAGAAVARLGRRRRYELEEAPVACWAGQGRWLRRPLHLLGSRAGGGGAGGGSHPGQRGHPPWAAALTISRRPHTARPPTPVSSSARASRLRMPQASRAACAMTIPGLPLGVGCHNCKVYM